MKKFLIKIELLISNSIAVLGADGLAHLLVCMMLIMVLAPLMNLWLAILIVLCVGIGKELYDKFTKKTEFSTKDLICDVIGIIFGLCFVAFYAIK